MASTIEEVEQATPRGLNHVPKKGDPPKFGTAKPAEQGKIPRFANPLERVRINENTIIAGAKRFKLSCRNYNLPAMKPVKYVIAASEEEAKALYRKETGLDAEVASIKKKDGRKDFEPEQPDLVCIALAD